LVWFDLVGLGAQLPIHPLEMGGLAFSFFLMADSGLPMRFSSDLANLAFARFCAGVWAWIFGWLGWGWTWIGGDRYHGFFGGEGCGMGSSMIRER
jgi:hypothetical protein